MTGARLGIAGIGLIGGSIALRARALGASVIGYDRDAAALAAGLAGGVLAEVADDLAALSRGCETLVIALPVDAARCALESLAAEAGPRLVIDVASVKLPLVAAGRAVANYLGTHPMAGREQGGLAAADPELFEGATWAHNPDPDSSLVARAKTFIAAMGANALEIDPFEHDAIVALTSHLPQALSVILGAELWSAAGCDDRVIELCGPGMVSMLRLARSPESTWAPIVAANAHPLAARLRTIARALLEAADGLEAGESARLMSYFHRAREAAGRLEKRFSPPPRS